MAQSLLSGLLAVAILLAATNMAHAEEPFADDEWAVFFTPYLWLAGLETSTRARGPFPATTTEVSMRDVLKSLDFGAEAAFEVRRNRMIGLVDFSYLDLSASKGLNGVPFTGASMETTTIFGSANAGYRVVEHDRGSFDLFAGVQFVWMDIDLAFSGGAPASTSSSQTLIDPIVGARGRLDLGSGFFVGTTGTIGGFGVDSELTWQLIGQAGWQANEWLTLQAGYRHFEIDFKSGGLMDNVTMSGPMIGATFRL